MEEETPNGGKFLPLSKPRLSLRRFLFYFITLAALLVIYLKISEFQLIKEVFLRSNFLWLFSIVVIQVLSYYFTALNYRDVLRVKDLNIRIKELFPITFVIQFLNQALPSAGFSGQVFFIQYLKKFGLSVAEGIGRAILELTTLYMAFGAFFIISATILVRGGMVEKHPEVLYLIYSFLFFAIIAVSLFFIFQKRGRGKIARWMIDKLHAYFERRDEKKGKKVGENHAEHVAIIFDQFKSTLNLEVLRRHGRTFGLAFLWQVLVLFVSILTLYFLSFAIDYKISFSVAFITFTLTKFLSMVSFIPGALGVFEGGMTLILVSFGVPAGPALAMTLLLRAFTFWFPMPVGWILYRYYSHRQELENPYGGLWS